jgi:hypothetical protein
MWRNELTIARDVYHKHPHELTEEQLGYCREFLALALLENREADSQ